MNFWKWVNDNWVKILGVLVAVNGQITSNIASGQLEQVLDKSSIIWLSQIVSLLGAALFALGFKNTTEQKVAEAEVKVAKAMETAINASPPEQRGFARPSFLAALLIAVVGGLLLSGCASTPTKVLTIACDPEYEYNLERCAKAIGEVYEVKQKRAEELVTDPTTPPEIKSRIQKVEVAASGIIVELLRSTALYMDIKAQVAAGKSTQEQLEIANANLEGWVHKALPRLDSLIRAVGG